MRSYLRHRVPGGTYFFTVNLAERKHNDLLIRQSRHGAKLADTFNNGIR